MQTIVLDQPGRLSLTEMPPPAGPGPGEAVVRVHRIGVCGTDLHAFKGEQPYFSYPRILGHELGVEVLAVGAEVRNVHRGARAALRPYLECGRCDTCLRGLPNCCPNLMVIGAHVDGGMRERYVVAADHVHASRALSYDELALVETLSIGVRNPARRDVIGEVRAARPRCRVRRNGA